MQRRIGTWSFIGGILLAVLAGFGQLKEAWPIWVLAVLGLVVGGMNINPDDTKKFLLAAIGLSLSANAVNALPAVGTQITEILSNVVVFISAALLFIAGREIGTRLSRSRNYVIWVAALGLVVAAVAAMGIVPGDNAIWLLSSLGVIIGVLFVTRPDNEEGAENFILSAIALQLSVSAFHDVPAIGAVLTDFFLNTVAVIFAVLLVVTFVTVFRIMDKLG